MRRVGTRSRSDERFAVGSKVTSGVTAQGLKEGKTYTVEAVRCVRTFVGDFTTVTVRDAVGVYEVRNPHLVLREVT